MKVIIKLNNCISLELEENPDMNDQVRIFFQRDTVHQVSGAVKIDDLKLALRKMTTK